MEADFGDSQKAGVATIQESMMDVLAQYSREFNRLFQLTMAHFVEINDDPFSMKKNGFTNFIKKCTFSFATLRNAVVLLYQCERVNSTCSLCAKHACMSGRKPVKLTISL